VVFKNTVGLNGPRLLAAGASRWLDNWGWLGWAGLVLRAIPERESVPARNREGKLMAGNTPPEAFASGARGDG